MGVFEVVEISYVTFINNRKLLLTALLLAEIAVPEPLNKIHAKLDILVIYPDNRIPLLYRLRPLYY
jgi:hypothetical protein